MLGHEPFEYASIRKSGRFGAIMRHMEGWNDVPCAIGYPTPTPNLGPCGRRRQKASRYSTSATVLAHDGGNLCHGSRHSPRLCRKMALDGRARLRQYLLDAFVGALGNVFICVHLRISLSMDQSAPSGCKQRRLQRRGAGESAWLLVEIGCNRKIRNRILA